MPVKGTIRLRTSLMTLFHIAGDVRGPLRTRIGAVRTQQWYFDVFGYPALRCACLATATGLMSACGIVA
jgi:hypothetical protein